MREDWTVLRVPGPVSCVARPVPLVCRGCAGPFDPAGLSDGVRSLDSWVRRRRYYSHPRLRSLGADGKWFLMCLQAFPAPGGGVWGAPGEERRGRAGPLLPCVRGPGRRSSHQGHCFLHHSPLVGFRGVPSRHAIPAGRIWQGAEASVGTSRLAAQPRAQGEHGHGTVGDDHEPCCSIR